MIDSARTTLARPGSGKRGILSAPPLCPRELHVTDVVKRHVTTPPSPERIEEVSIIGEHEQPPAPLTIRLTIPGMSSSRFQG